MKKGILINLLVGYICLGACNKTYTPRPLAYPKIVFPHKAYQRFVLPKYPYEFEYPTYALYQQDTFLLTQKPDNPYWINLVIDSLNATLYLTYKSLKNHSLDKLIFDSYQVTSKQVYKATSITDSVIQNPYGYKIMFYTVRGDAATTHQFFATDSTKHFLRGSLYLNATPKEDSLKIVNDFLKTDIIHLLETLRFR